MNKRRIVIVAILLSLVSLLLVVFIFQSPFFLLQVDSIRHAGTWEDDPKNWYRAFNEEPPGEIKIIHSRYWRSNHFTVEFECYFEVEATPQWRDKFLEQRNLKLVSPATAGGFRTNNHSDGTPHWFAPDPVDRYDVWDKVGYPGSVWIDKTNGHIFFYDWQV